MRLKHLARVLVVVAGVSVTASHGLAQTAGGLRAEINTIKKEIEELKQAAASAPTLAQAVQELSSKMVVLEQEMARNARVHESVPHALDLLDGLHEDVHRLQKEVEYLRTGIANIEQPAVQGGGAGATHEKGMYWSTADGRYDMTLGGYAQPRLETELDEDFSSVDESTFRIRRGRLNLKGRLGSERWRYATSVELTEDSAPLLNYYLDMVYRPELTVRLGQAKVPYTRSFGTLGRDRIFHELNQTQELQRYDRDIGVWALGTLWDERIHYRGGLSNGAGRNQRNDNIDFVQALRVEGVVLGDYIEPGFADMEGTEDPALTVGAAFAHDLVRLPTVLAGIEVGNRDVDGNGIEDNIRVLSSVVDAQFRHKGLELYVEGTWRHERWGSILDHDDNADIAAAVQASDEGRRNYLGITGQASYFVMPGRLLVGGRLSHGRLPLLGLGGRSQSSPPLAQRALQIDGIVQLYRDGYRRLGLSYGLVNFNEKDGPDPSDDIQHTFIVEAQFVL